MVGRFPHDYPNQEELDARVARGREDPHLRGPGKSVFAAIGALVVVLIAGWWLWSIGVWAWGLLT